MGISTSKSPLERRNTVARRSQRRIIHGLKSKVDKVYQDINKFRGTEEDEKYQQLSREVNRIRHELKSRSRDLQPQVRNIHQTTMNKLEEASEALQNKVIENQEKARKREIEEQEKKKQKEKKTKKKDKKKDEDDDFEVTEVQDDEEDGDGEDDEQQYGEQEAHEKTQLENSTEKRQTVELKLIKVIPESTIEADVHTGVSSPKMKSAEEKRKSILKYGVQVLPGVSSGQSTKKISIVSPDEPQLPNGNSNNILDKITDINEQLEAIEYQIADFVGKRNGTQYNRIRNKLISYLTEVSEMNTNDSYNIEQITLCKNYVGSCLNFLDERAVEDKKFPEDERVLKNEGTFKLNDTRETNDDVKQNHRLQDDVFVAGNNNVLSQDEVNLKLQKLTKTTAI